VDSDRARCELGASEVWWTLSERGVNEVWTGNDEMDSSEVVWTRRRGLAFERGCGL
jgi:hypothetical protein